MAFFFHGEAALLVGKALLVFFDQQGMLAHFQVEPPGGKERTKSRDDGYGVEHVMGDSR